MKPSEIAAQLRQLADDIEKLDELMPSAVGPVMNIFFDDVETMAAAAKIVGGTLRKDATGRYFYLIKNYTDFKNLFTAVRLEMNVERTKACTARVVGKKIVEKTDPNAPKIEVEEDIIEWDCNPILAAAADDV